MITMTERMERFFSPCVKLVLRSGIYMVADVHQFKLIQQFKEESGIKGSINQHNFDEFMKAAGNHGYSVETEER